MQNWMGDFLIMLLDTPVCDFGWTAPRFELPDFDGKVHSFDGLMGSRGLLVCFICNHCPYVKAIIDRLVSDASLLKAEGINTVSIMSNDYENYPDDSPDRMREFSESHNFGFPYLVDESQTVARDYDAVCTPDFFGFNSDGLLQYRGRLDDSKMGDSTNRVAELLDGMLLVSRTGEGPREQHPSMGCSIKWR